jgi:hypothetical protein
MSSEWVAAQHGRAGERESGHGLSVGRETRLEWAGRGYGDNGYR